MKTLIIKDILFHADDYGANEEISGHIIDCISKGALRSISILPNSGRLGPCMKLFDKRAYEFKGRTVRRSIHFNIAEGRPLSPPEEIPLLVNGEGMFCTSFFKVLLWSFTGRRAELKRQLTAEYKRQIEAVLPYIDEIRIDSHQHYHMIPLALSCILSVCEEASDGTGKPITFIRVPAEPISPFIRHPSVWPGIKPINIIKNMVLNTLHIMDRGLLKPYRERTAIFFGITFSGSMDYPKVKRVLKDFIMIAARRGLPLEVLAHPGGVSSTGDLMDVGNSDCVTFYTSKGRAAEKEMLLKIASNKGGRK